MTTLEPTADNGPEQVEPNNMACPECGTRDDLFVVKDQTMVLVECHRCYQESGGPGKFRTAYKRQEKAADRMAAHQETAQYQHKQRVRAAESKARSRRRRGRGY